MIYGELIPTQEAKSFEARLNEIAALLVVRAEWLLQVMWMESRLRPWIQNTVYPFKNGCATGLIQFTPDTAIGLGTTVDKLKTMSRLQQLEFVYRHFKPYAGKMKSYYDVYLVVFFPEAIAHSIDDNWVFETANIKRSSIAKSNPAIDINKDGMISMAEFKTYCKLGVVEKYRTLIF